MDNINIKEDKYIVGIDIGGSTTKICGFKIEEKELIKPLYIKASDQVSSLYGAFGKFTSSNNISLNDIKEIQITGVGSTFISEDIYGIPTKSVEEFKAIGMGGVYLSTLDSVIVVSMGTGTALVKADKNGSTYLGGTGVGGGTIVGLSKLMLNMGDVDNVVKIAEKGNLRNIDLKIGDITKKDIIPGMPDYLTAANFGKIGDLTTKEDIALGIFNLVFEAIGMTSILAARQFGIEDIVLTGNLTRIIYCRKIFEALNDMFKVRFQIPEYAQFGTAIGAALCCGEL